MLSYPDPGWDVSRPSPPRPLQPALDAPSGTLFMLPQERITFLRHAKEKIGSARPVLAVEIKAGKRVAGADLSGLRSFGQAHPDVPQIVVAQVPEPHRLGTVSVVPYREFLVRLEAHVEQARD